MIHIQNNASKKLTLAIHSTDQSFGFAFRENKNKKSDHLFFRKFDNNLCNNLIVDFKKFISTEDLKRVNKISVSTGPANFNASRLIVVFARIISQQISCPLDSFSCFELMAKRIALRNNISTNMNSFWIYKKLKRNGFIAGKYQIYIPNNQKGDITIREQMIPSLLKELRDTEPNFQADYDDKKDLKELLSLSDKNSKIPNVNSWETVLPLYPLSPFN